MTTATKLAQRTVHSDFAGQQSQRLAQDAARKVNSHADMLNALLNRSYAALATDTGNTATAVAYATLLTANITTVLASGYLLITFTASGVEVTLAGTAFFQIVVDGVVVKGCYTTVVAGAAFTASMVVRRAVARGAHVVLLQWRTSVNDARINAASVVTEHAHLLVQEVA